MSLYKEVTTRINPDRCTGCGLCISVCPADTISIEENKAVVTGKHSLGCGHCMAVCPEDAVSVDSIAPDTIAFTHLPLDKKWVNYGESDTEALVRLMGSRRSCRNYDERSVADSLLEDLVKAGITAPSGTNAQAWTFTIIPTKNAMSAFANQVASFYQGINKLAGNPFLRLGLKLIGQKDLDDYYRNYYNAVENALQAWREEGKDLLFHGASAAIVIATKPDASCPTEDALLASQNILLTAHSLGLGSCLIGFAVIALQRKPAIKEAIGIPREEKVQAVIALGYPKERYSRIVGRPKPPIRYFNPAE